MQNAPLRIHAILNLLGPFTRLLDNLGLSNEHANPLIRVPRTYPEISKRESTDAVSSG